MTHDEARKKLEELGLKEGTWKNFEGKEIQIEFKTQKEILRKIRALVEAEVKKNKHLAEQLHIAKNKMKFGGGS